MPHTISSSTTASTITNYSKLSTINSHYHLHHQQQPQLSSTTSTSSLSINNQHNNNNTTITSITNHNLILGQNNNKINGHNSDYDKTNTDIYDFRPNITSIIDNNKESVSIKSSITTTTKTSLSEAAAKSMLFEPKLHSISAITVNKFVQPINGIIDLF